MATIGDRLREQRTRAGLSLGQAGKYENTTAQYLSDLERGRNSPPTWDLLARLARRYRCSADYLLGLVEHPNGILPAPVLPSYGQDVLDLMARLSEPRRRELVAHAQVLIDAEQQQEADLAQLRGMLDTVEAVGGADALNAILEILAVAQTDNVAALALMDKWFAERDNPVVGRPPVRRQETSEKNGEQA